MRDDRKLIWFGEVEVPSNLIEEARAAMCVGLFFIYGTHGGRCGRQWDATNTIHCPKPKGHDGPCVPFTIIFHHGPPAPRKRVGLVAFRRA